MIIDAHTHIGFGGAITASTGQLLASMDANGVDKALVYAGSLSVCLTDRLLVETETHAGRLYAVGYANAADATPDGLRLIEKLFREKKLVALKFYPGYEHFYPADASIRPILELCQSYGVPAIFHTGDCYNKVAGAKLKYSHPLNLDELAVEMPGLKIMMAHLGNPWLIDAAEVCYKNPNVYADCSGYVCGDFTGKQKEKFIHLVREFLDFTEQPEKFLFGSDWPISHQGPYLRIFEEAVRGDSKLWELATERVAVELFGMK